MPFSVVKDGVVEDVVYRKLTNPNTGKMECYIVELFGKKLCQIRSFCKGEWNVIVYDDHAPQPIEPKHRLVYGFATRYHCVAYALKLTGIWE